MSREYLSQDEAKGIESTKGTIWHIWGEDEMRESEGLKDIMDNDVKVLYKVTVKYKGVDQIPTGILIEAQSLNDNFSVCEFCYNVQKNVKFHYKYGTIIEDSNLNIIKKVKSIARRKTNQFHLKDNECKNFESVEPKYINETTAAKKDLINAELNACEKCM